MTMTTNHNLNIYCKYTTLVNKINSKYGLTNLQKQIFDEITIACERGDRLTVTEILELNHFASHTTLHAALKELIAKGLVRREIDIDERIKLLSLTEIGIERCQEISNSLAECLTEA